MGRWLPSQVLMKQQIAWCGWPYCLQTHVRDCCVLQVELTMLHVTNTLAYNLSSLAPLFVLTSLRQLHLVTYGADPDDIDFR